MTTSEWPMATLNIRGIDLDAVKGIKLAAGARGMTIGQYVAALYQLHQVAIRTAVYEDKIDRDPEVLVAPATETKDLLADAGLPVIFI